jgi:hypothetical protein
MLSRTHRALLAACVAALAPLSTMAARLPAATSALEVAVDNFLVPKTSSKFTTIKVSYTAPWGSSESALASSTHGATPAIHAHAMGVCSANGCLGGPDIGQSVVRYAFKVVGPKGTAKVDFTASAATSHTTVDGAYANYAIQGLYGADFCAGAEDSCMEEFDTMSEGPTFDESGPIDVAANQVYYVTMTAVASAVGATTPASIVDATLTATIKLDPMYEGAYVLELGKGIEAAP